MIKQKMYEVIRAMLVDDARLRDNDKALIWKVWEHELGANRTFITKGEFEELSTPETITRARRQVQEDRKELGASRPVAVARSIKERQKGNFVYQEPVTWGLWKAGESNG